MIGGRDPYLPPRAPGESFERWATKAIAALVQVIREGSPLSPLSIDQPNLADNQVLSFDSATGHWVNGTPTVSWSNVTSTPTTLDGYGITDGSYPMKDLVRDYGADPTGATDSDTALSDAITAGEPVTCPVGTFTFAGNHTITAKNNFAIIGSGNFNAGTIFRFAQTTGDWLTISNCQHVLIKGIYFRPTAIRTAGYAIKLTGGSFFCRILGNRFDYGFNGVWVDQATECEVSLNMFRHSLGGENIRVGGDATSEVYRCEIHSNRADNPYPYSSPAPGDVITRTNSLAVTQGQVAVFGGYIWQVTTAGTTAGSGTPSPPSSSASGFFDDEVTDGTAGWKVACDDDLIHLLIDSFAYSIVTAHNAFLNGATTVKMTSSVATATDNRPKWLWMLPIESDHPYYTGINLEYGEGVWIDNSWIGSSIAGDGIEIAATFTGEAYIQSSRILANALHGIVRNSGPSAIGIHNNQIGSNSQAGSGTYHGIVLAASSRGTRITGNKIGQLPSGPTETQGYAISAGSNCDETNVTGNDLENNVTGAIAGLQNGVPTSVVVMSNVGVEESIWADRFWLATDTYLTLDGSGNPEFNFDSTDYMVYDQATNTLKFIIGGVSVVEFDSGGVSLGGGGGVYLPLAGGTMTGAIAMGTSKITGLGDATADTDALNRQTGDARFLQLAGGTMTGNVDMDSSEIDNVGKLWFDTNAYLQLSGTDFYMNLDANDYLGYDRTNNTWNFTVGGTNQLTINSTGLRAGSYTITDSTHLITKTWAETNRAGKRVGWCVAYGATVSAITSGFDDSQTLEFEGMVYNTDASAQNMGIQLSNNGGSSYGSTQTLGSISAGAIFHGYITINFSTGAFVCASGTGTSTSSGTLTVPSGCNAFRMVNGTNLNTTMNVHIV